MELCRRAAFSGEVKGDVLRDLDGPRPPEFPDLDEHNLCWKFLGNGGRLEVQDGQSEGSFKFSNGDTIVIEAWVNLTGLPDGSHAYVIGKGRTHTGSFPHDNQNWALRLTGRGGEACLSFLFATAPGAGDQHWHRWTSEASFPVRSGWHHVAVSYTFGEPESVRGWIDSQRTSGRWDMGGKTTEAPVVDDAPVWIGASMGGSNGNSFRGRLDEVVVHRGHISDSVMERRFRRVGPPREVLPLEVAPEVLISQGSVRIELYDGMALHDQWPEPDEPLPQIASVWLQSRMLVPQFPQRYDSWGIRDEWHPPVLLRGVVEIELPAGAHRFLIRGRGLSRLWVNGQVVARIGPHRGSSDGHEPVDPLPLPPAPDHRIAAYGDQEAFGELVLEQDTLCTVVYESMVGSKRLRAEPGELMVALQRSGSATFELLQDWNSGSPALSLRHEEIDLALEQSRQQVVAHDTRERRALARSRSEYWQDRHQAAREWAAQTDVPEIPMVSSDEAGGHPIDQFLAARVAQARAEATANATPEADYFYREIGPILEARCQRCHGAKSQGGLRLDSLAAALRGGDSGAAIEPGSAADSELFLRISSDSDGDLMPPDGKLSDEEIAKIRQWLDAGAAWPTEPIDVATLDTAPLIDDVEFLRRGVLDIIGLPATANEVRAFLADESVDKREAAIDRLLDDARWADHWVSYWQDVLAENPTC
ncbi:MAG: c-type cytochrome domain-containing protein [Pirellulaceae bacterium]